MQKQQPIAFENKKLRGREKNYSIYDKEMFFVMHTLNLGNIWLERSSFSK
jgi:hypothetical protein